jgi:hypothetical protein
MPRAKLADAPTAPPPVHVIAETGVYSVAQARAIFGLKASTIRRELKHGRLRVAKRAGRYYLLGEWLLSWIREGELQRRRPALNGQEAAS